MKIQDISGQTQLVDRVIEKSISHLVIIKNKKLANETVSIKKVSKNGGQGVTSCTNMKLIDLYEIAAQGEGSFVNKDNQAYGEIQLGVAGAAVALEEGEYLLLSLRDLDDESTYQVFGSESPVAENSLLVYEKINITSGTDSKKMNVGRAHAIALPHSKLEALDVTYNNGNTTTLYPEELTVKSGVANDIVAIETAGVVYGHKNLHSIDVQHAVNYEVFTSGEGYNFYTIAVATA